MAEVSVAGGQVSIQLSLGEKVGALHGDIRLPRAAVRAVRVVDRPFAEVRGFRSPGTRIPGFMALGTWRRSRGPEFVAVYRGQRGVVLEVDASLGKYQRIIISTHDPDRICDLLAAAA
jgi:uncharacterized protein